MKDSSLSLAEVISKLIDLGVDHPLIPKKNNEHLAQQSTKTALKIAANHPGERLTKIHNQLNDLLADAVLDEMETNIQKLPRKICFKLRDFLLRAALKFNFGAEQGKWLLFYEKYKELRAKEPTDNHEYYDLESLHFIGVKASDNLSLALLLLVMQPCCSGIGATRKNLIDLIPVLYKSQEALDLKWLLSLHKFIQINV